MSPSVQLIESDRDRDVIVAELRRRLSGTKAHADRGALPFGLPTIDRHLPAGGLARGTLHEFTAADVTDMPAAFGFVATLAGRALAAKNGQALLVLSGRSLADFGRPYAHGLGGLGLPQERLILLETANDVQVLWALEEALRLCAVAAVGGWIGGKLPLKASRRLQIAAESSGALLFLLRPPQAEEANAATTRWRVAAAPAARDRFGCFSRWRWRIALERCRNGRTGMWVVELRDPESSDAAHSFDLVGPMADPAFPEGTGAEPLRSAGRSG